MEGVAGGVMRATAVDPLPLRPTEYFHRQCFVANSLMSRRDVDARAAIGTDVLMWGSDAPHQEGAWPKVHGKLRELFEGVPLADAQAVVGGNFLRAYPVDAARMATIASTIGPHPADLGILAPADA